MVRKWINSADVEVSDKGAVATSESAASTFAGGAKIVASAATAEKLVAASTPCRGVWIGARKDANGAACNVGRVLLGDSGSQHIPLETTDTKGMTLAIDDASKLYVKVFSNGDGVDYHIFV